VTASPGGTRFALTHRTSYAFDRPVALAPHEIRLRPAPHAHARIASYSLTVEPAAHTLHWQQDAYANWVARLTFPQRASRLALRVDLAGELVEVNPFDFFVDPEAAVFPFAYAPVLRRALVPCLAPAGADSLRVASWVDAFRTTIAPGEQTIGLLVRLNRHLRRDVDYRIRDEPGVQSADATLAARSGSCRDSAWLLIEILRTLGIAARFVSGYLIELAAGYSTEDSTEGSTANATEDAPADATKDTASLHAWTEAFIPGAGWIGLDPTSGLLAAGGHQPLACAADPQLASPVSGTTDVCNVSFEASIDVTRITVADSTVR
jgi:transglutaminase-like putative cysteine protease